MNECSQVLLEMADVLTHASEELKIIAGRPISNGSKWELAHKAVTDFRFSFAAIAKREISKDSLPTGMFTTEETYCRD